MASRQIFAACGVLSECSCILMHGNLNDYPIVSRTSHVTAVKDPWEEWLVGYN
jgi:hypothetical protein